LLYYLGKLKIEFFADMEENAQEIVVLVAFNFVIHPQMLIFSVFKIASLRSLHMTVRSTIASTHHVTQGSAALLLSARCVVARRSASR